jgi:hypothetical protein
MAEYDGGVWDYGCGYPQCKFSADCPVGKQLEELTANMEA